LYRYVSAALAIHRELPEAFDVFKSILAAGADPSECALFPEGSECPPLVELLHVLREGRVDRVEVLGLITSLLDAGADVRTCYPEVYCLEPHRTYAAAESDPRAEPLAGSAEDEARGAEAAGGAGEGSLVGLSLPGVSDWLHGSHWLSSIEWVLTAVYSSR
jgi:hypothetical protein